MGDKGELFANEVRAARANGFQMVMVHENDEADGGCEFARFFETTPQDLIADGLYKALAYAWYPDPFRQVSVALVALAFGAEEPHSTNLAKQSKRLGKRAVREFCVSWAACLALPVFNRGKPDASKAAKASTSTPKPVSADPEAQTEESRMGQAAASAFASAPAATKSVELVRTPLGLGLTVDGQYNVVAIAKDGQAKRSRGIAVGDQLVSINGVPLSGGGSFDEQLGAIAVGTKVRLMISKPAGGSAKRSRIGGLLRKRSSSDKSKPAAAATAATEDVVLVDEQGGAPDGGWL